MMYCVKFRVKFNRVPGWAARSGCLVGSSARDASSRVLLFVGFYRGVRRWVGYEGVAEFMVGCALVDVDKIRVEENKCVIIFCDVVEAFHILQARNF